MHPFLFRIGSFEVGTYGLMLAIGFLTALWLAKRLGRIDGVAQDAIVDISITVLVAGIVGAKLLMIIVDLYNGATLSQVLSIGTLRAGGAVHGGILAGIAAFFWRVRKLRVPAFKTIDIAVTAVPLGQAIGRLGCLAAGCCYGTYCEMPWAITFHNHDAARFGTPLEVALHPVQLYFGLASLLILAILLFFRRFRKFPGHVAGLYFILEGIARLALETWRGDADRGIWFGIDWLSTGRLTALAFILIGVGIWAWAAAMLRPAKSGH